MNTNAAAHASLQETLNLSTWSKDSALRDLDRVSGFVDPGERAAIAWAAERVRGKPILDVGVGTGRTIPLVKPIAGEYRALDFSPAMVALSRRAHPGASIEVGDARTLEGFPDDHFGLVMFSYNGIDAVPHEDRRLVLRAARRVLEPGGLFLFSTLNLDGPSYRERPWKVRVWSTRNPLKVARRVAAQVACAPLDFVRWWRIRDHAEHGAGFAVAPLSAHHYGVLAHYTTLRRQLDELAEEGFARDPVVFDNLGRRWASAAGDASDVDWFHIVAAAAHGGEDDLP